MTAAELKASILDLAVRGQLVPQDPKDKPADKPSDIDDPPYELPRNWVWVYLKDIGTIIGGGTPKTNDKASWESATIPWLTPADMRDHVCGKYISHGARNISEHGLRNSSARLMPKDSIVYSSRAPIGYIAITLNELCTNQGFKSVVPNDTRFNDYLYYAIISRKDDIIKRASGTTFKEISGKDFGLTAIPLPPLTEQKRIVAKIEELLPLVEEYGAAQKELEALNADFPAALRESILQDAVQGKLTAEWRRARFEKVERFEKFETARELLDQIAAERAAVGRARPPGAPRKKEKSLPPITDDEKPFEIPDTWSWCRLGEIGKTNIGLTYKPKDIVEDQTAIPVLRANNIQDGRLEYSNLIYVTTDVPPQCVCHVGDLIICARNGSKRLVGKSAIVNKEGMAFGAFMAIFRSPFNEYVKLILNSSLFRKTFDGDTSTSTINQITQNMLRAFPIPLPPLAEQKAIVERVDELLKIVDAMKAQ